MASVLVTSNVPARLAAHRSRRGGDAPARGFLVGPSSSPSDDARRAAAVVGSICAIDDHDDDDATDAAAAGDAPPPPPPPPFAPASFLPGGLEICGAYASCADGEDAREAAEALLRSLDRDLLVASTSTSRSSPAPRGFVLAVATTDDADGVAFFLAADDATAAIEDVVVETAEEGWLEREYATLRCAMKVPVFGGDRRARVDALDAAEEEASSPGRVFALDLTGDDGEGDDAVAAARAGGGGGGRGGKKGKKGKGGRGGGGGGATTARPPATIVLGLGGDSDAASIASYLSDVATDVTPLVRGGASSASASPPPAPTLTFSGRASGGGADAATPRAEYFARVDALAYVPRARADGALASTALRASLATRLRAMKRLSDAIGAPNVSRGVGSVASETEPRSLHFLPPGLEHYVTVEYPLPKGDALRTSATADPDEGLERTRAKVHEALGLSLDRPRVRVANALGRRVESIAGAKGPFKLRTVHADARVPLPPSHVVGGTQHLVQGGYDYHHYMQDGFDDSGWGCAYRSCQVRSMHWSPYGRVGVVNADP